MFEDEDDRFDPARHQVALNLKLKQPMKDALSQLKVEVIPHNTPLPLIKKVFDRKSRTTNDRLTPGHQLDIHGDLLKIGDEAAEDQGVYLVNTSNAEETKIAYFFQNTAKTLEVELPEDLKAGTYRLEVRTAVYNAKAIRTGYSPIVLTVV